MSSNEEESILEKQLRNRNITSAKKATTLSGIDQQRSKNIDDNNLGTVKAVSQPISNINNSDFPCKSEQHSDIQKNNLYLESLSNTGNNKTVVKNPFNQKRKMSLDMNLAYKLIPEFDGSSRKLHKFIFSCDMIFKKLNEEFNEEALIEMVMFKLQDKAHEIFKHKQFKNYSDMKREIKVQFSESRPIEYLQVELVRASQLPNENVKNFAHRIEQLLTDLNDACIAREGDESSNIIHRLNATTALKSFQDGLKSSLQVIIKACRFTELKDAIAKAIEEEATLNYKLASLPQENSSTFTKPFRPKCQICKKIGHYADTCYRNEQKKINPDNFNSIENSNRTYVSNSGIQPIQSSFSNQHIVSCDYCKRIGHHIKNCRQRKYAETNRAQPNFKPTIQTIKDSGNEKPLVQEPSNTAVRVKDLR